MSEKDRELLLEKNGFTLLRVRWNARLLVQTTPQKLPRAFDDFASQRPLSPTETSLTFLKDALVVVRGLSRDHQLCASAVFVRDPREEKIDDSLRWAEPRVLPLLRYSLIQTKREEINVPVGLKFAAVYDDELVITGAFRTDRFYLNGWIVQNDKIDELERRAKMTTGLARIWVQYRIRNHDNRTREVVLFQGDPVDAPAACYPKNEHGIEYVDFLVEFDPLSRVILRITRLADEHRRTNQILDWVQAECQPKKVFVGVGQCLAKIVIDLAQPQSEQEPRLRAVL